MNEKHRLSERKSEVYKDYDIYFFSFRYNFWHFDDIGWAFQATRSDQPLFKMEVTTAGGSHDGSFSDKLFGWGIDWMRRMIDAGKYEVGGDYCFDWQLVMGESEPETADCDELRKRPSA